MKSKFLFAFWLLLATTSYGQDDTTAQPPVTPIWSAATGTYTTLSSTGSITSISGMNGRVHIIPVYKDTDFSYQRYMCDRGDTTFMLDHLEYLLNNVYAPQYNKLNKEYEHLEVKRKRAEKGVQQKRHPNLSDVNAQIEAEMAVMDKLVELGVVKGEIDILTRLIQENSQPYIQTNRQ